MLLAALLDLGDPRFGIEHLQELAADLVPGEATLESERVWRGSLSGCLLDVRTPETVEPPHRHYADLERIVGGSALSSAVKARSLEVLWRIAVAEARVHDTTPEKIHFHEVGAVDTLIDVCGAMLALERLGNPGVTSGVPLVGSGTVHCAHGEMPVPAPATAELLRGRELKSGGGGERLTPTAAALLATLCPAFGDGPTMTTESIGYGAGHRDPAEGPPNLVRVQLGLAAQAGPVQAGAAQFGAEGLSTAWQLEVNLDDMTGEELGWLCEGLREAGALDVWTSALQMKKNRPGVLLGLLCRAEQRASLEQLVFERSSTFGLRWHEVQRREAERGWIQVELEGQAVRVKVRRRPSGNLDGRDLAPEQDDLQQICRGTGHSLRSLTARAVAAALEKIESGESPFESGPPSASGGTGTT